MAHYLQINEPEIGLKPMLAQIQGKYDTYYPDEEIYAHSYEPLRVEEKNHQHGTTRDSFALLMENGTSAKNNFVPELKKILTDSSSHDPKATNITIGKDLNSTGPEIRSSKLPDTAIQLWQANHVLKQLETFRTQQRDRIQMISRMAFDNEALKEQSKKSIAVKERSHDCPCLDEVCNLKTKMDQLQGHVSKLHKEQGQYKELLNENFYCIKSEELRRETHLKAEEMNKFPYEQEDSSAVKEKINQSRLLKEDMRRKISILQAANNKFLQDSNKESGDKLNADFQLEIEMLTSQNCTLSDHWNKERKGYLSERINKDYVKSLKFSLESPRAEFKLGKKQLETGEEGKYVSKEERQGITITEIPLLAKKYETSHSVKAEDNKMKKLSDQKDSVDYTSIKYKELQEQLTHLQKEFISLRKENESRNEKIGTQELIITYLQQQRDELKVAVSAGAKKQERLKQENEEIFARLQAKQKSEGKTSTAAFEEKILKLKDSNVKLEHSLVEAKESIKKLQILNNKSEGENITLIKERNEMLLSLKQLKERNNYIANEMSLMNKDTKVLEEEIFSLRKQLKHAEETLMSTQSHTTNVEDKCSELEADNIRLRGINKDLKIKTCTLEGLYATSNDHSHGNKRLAKRQEEFQKQSEKFERQHNGNRNLFLAMTEDNNECALRMQILTEENILLHNKHKRLTESVSSNSQIFTNQSNEDGQINLRETKSSTVRPGDGHNIKNNIDEASQSNCIYLEKTMSSNMNNCCSNPLPYQKCYQKEHARTVHKSGKTSNNYTCMEKLEMVNNKENGVLLKVGKEGHDVATDENENNNIGGLQLSSKLQENIVGGLPNSVGCRQIEEGVQYPEKRASYPLLAGDTSNEFQNEVEDDLSIDDAFFDMEVGVLQDGLKGSDQVQEKVVGSLEGGDKCKEIEADGFRDEVEEDLTIDDAFFNMVVGVLPDNVRNIDTDKHVTSPIMFEDTCNNATVDSRGENKQQIKGEPQIITSLSKFSSLQINEPCTRSLSSLGPLPPLPAVHKKVKKEKLKKNGGKRRKIKKRKVLRINASPVGYSLLSSKCNAKKSELEGINKDEEDDGESTTADIDDLPNDH